MAFVLANPDRLFDRTWRPRHPLRPRLSSTRRRCMLLVFLLLCTIIFGYTYLTDSRRVRDMAGSYLSDLLGGDVKIGNASLTIFEGLRLDDVTLRIDQSNRPESIIFHASTFWIRYNPYELLAGRLAATQIIAIEPKVMLVEDPAAQQWNYQRLWNAHLAAHKANPNKSGSPMALPQIILRDAQVDYIQMVGGVPRSMGYYTIGGTLTPSDEPERYSFELQSRGRESMGPSVKGSISTNGGQSSATANNFPFGPDIETVLPREPRAWCEQHELQGRIDVPEMVYDPGSNGAKPTFRVEIALSGVGLAVRPEEWMSRQQNEHLQLFHEMLDSEPASRWIPANWISALHQLSTPQPVHLRQCSGTLVFTEQGIQLRSITGKLENNWFTVDGKIAGYSPDAVASITASGQNLDLPAWSPTYVGSMPAEAQEVYEHLHPQGTCSVTVNLDRASPGAAPTVSGRIDIKDGQFCFDDFPYPLVKTTGTILLGHDSFKDMDGVRLINVQGRGIPGGPNENALVTMDGFIGPLPGIAGVWIDIRGKNINTETAVRNALPRTVDRVLRTFDPDGEGVYPKFHGDFSCHLVRPPGPKQRWEIDVDLNVNDAEGKLAMFPYPIRDMTGRLEIRDGFLNVIDAHMRHGDAGVAIDGRVTWKTPITANSTQAFGPDLHIVAQNLPLDDDLKSALPPLQKQWINKMGATGKLDVEGHVKASNAHVGRDMDWQFDMSLHDGSLWPVSGVVAFSGVSGKMQLTPDQLLLSDFTAHRGSGTVLGHGAILWGENDPKVEMVATADKLPLDASLYQMLPVAAREDWDSLRPRGTVDASLNFQSMDQYELKIRPHDLSVTPQAIPYQLTDVKGMMTVLPHKVLLSDVTAKHGAADISISGQGDFTKEASWDFKMAGSQIPVDDDLLRALPESVNGIVKAMQLQGTIGLEFSKLAYRPTSTRPQNAASGPGSSGGPDMDFAVKIMLDGASMDVGLPASDVVGSIELAGLVRDGNMQRFAGQLYAPKLKLVGRPASDFKIVLSKPTDDPVIGISSIEGAFAGGDIAGKGQLTLADANPGKYDLSLVLREADIAQLTGPSERKIKGHVTASLQLSGAWNDPLSRRGHGDVRVHGDALYNIPLVLGLLQVTNLSLPLSSPFSEATSGYNIDGQKVTFESIYLKSKDMTMSGGGQLDFGAKKVNLWLVTDNPTLIALPVIGPLIHSAKEELLKIRVNGTIQQPKVSASSFDTITTTVDEVFRGDDKSR
jgi:hypothetical protein